MANYNTDTQDCIDNKFFHREIRAVSLKNLACVDFNREINPNNVKNIVDDFDIHRMDLPHVYPSDIEGVYNVWDGQHRVSALRAIMQDEDATIDVIVDDVTHEEAARLFAQQDKNRKPVMTTDKFKANLVAKDPICCEIQRILSNYGLAVGRGNPVNRIQAVNELIKAYISLGSERFEGMIYVMQAGFNGKAGLWKAATIKGMTAFYKSYRDSVIDGAHLIKQLSKLDPDAVANEAKTFRPKNKPEGFAGCIVREYNKNRRGKATLDPDIVNSI